MAEVMMTLGSFRFSLSTAAYSELQRTWAFRWPEQKRIGNKSASHYTGPDAPTLEIKGTIYPYYKGGLGQVDAMVDMAGKGEPLLLTDGRGKVWGKYGITEITDAQTSFEPNGDFKKADFTLSLIWVSEAREVT